jgi:hypothetical protein
MTFPLFVSVGDFKALLPEDLNGGRDSGFDGVVRVVEDGSALGDDEWSGRSLAIGGIAFGDGIDFTVFTAAGGTDVLGGIDVDFVGRIREDDGADVPAFHDDAGMGEVAALEIDEFFSDFRNGGDG